MGVGRSVEVSVPDLIEEEDPRIRWKLGLVDADFLVTSSWPVVGVEAPYPCHWKTLVVAAATQILHDFQAEEVHLGHLESRNLVMAS